MVIAIVFLIGGPGAVPVGVDDSPVQLGMRQPAISPECWRMPAHRLIRPPMPGNFSQGMGRQLSCNGSTLKLFICFWFGSTMISVSEYCIASDELYVLEPEDGF